jgi:hypothetical protein
MALHPLTKKAPKRAKPRAKKTKVKKKAWTPTKSRGALGRRKKLGQRDY